MTSVTLPVSMGPARLARSVAFGDTGRDAADEVYEWSRTQFGPTGPAQSRDVNSATNKSVMIDSIANTVVSSASPGPVGTNEH